MPKEASVIYIGRRPPMNYVLAVITSFNTGNAEQVVLKARGQAITTAVDVAEIARGRFLKNVKVDKITTGTEELPRQEGGTRGVSSIEITLTRSPATGEEKAGEEVEAVRPPRPLELTRIEGIGVKGAKKMEAAGINSVQDLAESDASELSKKIHVSEKRVSKWIDEARKALNTE